MELKHLEGSKTLVKLLFIDFSIAFNPLQPHILADEFIPNFGLDLNLTGWVLDFLTERVNGSLSAPLITSTGSPQGCVFLLYCIFYIQMTAQVNTDDTVIVRNNDFVIWCDDARLQLNLSKAKDTSIDFRTEAFSS